MPEKIPQNQRRYRSAVRSDTLGVRRYLSRKTAVLMGDILCRFLLIAGATASPFGGFVLLFISAFLRFRWTDGCSQAFQHAPGKFDASGGGFSLQPVGDNLF